MTDTCDRFLSREIKGVTRVSRRRASVFFRYTCTVFSGSCADRVSQKSGPRIRSAIHDLHVSLVRTLPRGTEYIFVYNLSKRLQGSVPARVRNVSQ